jgi:hypothetical protein
VCRKANKRCWLFLFNDCLAYGYPKDSKETSFTLSNVYALNAVTVERKMGTRHSTAGGSGSGGGSKAKQDYRFIVDAFGDGAKSFEVIAPNEDVLESWVSDLQAHISTYESEKAENIFHPPVWQPDEKAVKCDITGRKFGLFCRKHHCRVCGRVVADEGAKNRIQVYNKAQRVCKVCWEDESQWKNLKTFSNVALPPRPGFGE